MRSWIRYVGTLSLLQRKARQLLHKRLSRKEAAALETQLNRKLRRSELVFGLRRWALFCHAAFMRRGAALVEVRPYHFEGDWPDKYFRALTSLEQAVHYLQVSSDSPELSIPEPSKDVSVWDARDHAVRLPWHTLSEVLRVAMWINRSSDRYVQRLWRHGVVFHSRKELQ